MTSLNEFHVLSADTSNIICRLRYEVPVLVISAGRKRKGPTPSAIKKCTPLWSVLSKTKFRKAVMFSGRVMSPSPSIPPSPKGKGRDDY